MSYELYQQTMKRLSQTLSDKFSIPIQYSDQAGSSAPSVIIPLVISRQTAGHLQVHPSVSTERLDEIYNHVQWTLNSLEELFQKHGVSFQSNEKNFPIWLPSLEAKRALKVALDMYERSSLKSFVHLDASVFDSSFFSADLKQVLIFISSAEQLSREDQLFLAHYLRTNKAGPSLIFSSSLPLESAKKMIVPSLMECFTSYWRHSEEWVNT
ncbi:MAG: hypothetical protein OXK80_00220 [Bdellovibrionales bacterium]|nr:hypothetical protein [Bdellovibrionales bacterium]